MRVLPGDRGNIVDPDGNRYVAPSQSPDGSSRVTPYHLGAPLARGLSHHIETHDEGTGARREIGLGS